MMVDPLFDSDIPWRSQPVPADEGSLEVQCSTADVEGLYSADILALERHLASVQADCAVYRELLQTAIEEIATLTTTITRLNRRLVDLTMQIRQFFGITDAQQRERGDGPVT